MYEIKSIKKHGIMANQFILVVDNDAAPGDTRILLSGESGVTLASRWPKDFKEFNLKQHVFKKVKDLEIGDKVITL
ncbi:hypothetical protein LCGC14_0543760 [marine sediment metagenome]|uniref:Uncharacterized protein n=1 Tax=marine sediment metagenome TaxID=412755 RepID=A0A0F9SAK2_9ZZZZ